MNIDIIHVFQRELGRLLSPIELEIIQEWQADGFSNFQIKEALKVAIFNGASANSYKYINKILDNWSGQKSNDAKIDQAVATMVNNNTPEVKPDTNAGQTQPTGVGPSQTTNAETEEEPDLSWLE